MNDKEATKREVCKRLIQCKGNEKLEALRERMEVIIDELDQLIVTEVRIFMLHLNVTFRFLPIIYKQYKQSG